MIQRRNTKNKYSATMHCFGLNIVSRGGEVSFLDSSDMGKKVSACDCIMSQNKPSANFRIVTFCFDYKKHLACAVRERSRLDIIKLSFDELSVLGLINTDSYFFCSNFCK